MKNKNTINRNTRALASFAILLFASWAVAQTPPATPPPAAPPRSVQFPKPIDKTLANGLRVIVVQRPQIPLVTAQLVIKSGGEVDPANLPGVADMTATLLTRGTKTRTATQIAEAIEALGGSINSGAGWDASSITTSVMSSRIGPAMEILSDVVRNPAFKDEEIDRLRQQNLNNLRVALGQPGAIARFVAARVVYHDAPYGHPLSGTPESLPKIKRDDIVRLHDLFYRPDNAVLILGGDIIADDGFAVAQKYLGDWVRPTTDLPRAAITTPASEPGNRRILVIDMPDAGQAAVIAARSGITRGSPDYFRGIVSNSVQVSSLALYGLPLDELNRFVSNVQAIKAEDVKAFASTRLNPDGTSVIVVGDAKKFLPDLKKQFSNVEVIPMTELDLNSADLRRATK